MAKNGAGNKLQWDAAKVQKLAMDGCSDTEIAYELGCTRKTIERLKKTPEYSAVIERGYAKGKVRLRSALMEMAIKDKNVTAAIWVSKQRHGVGLGFTDRIETDVAPDRAEKAALPSWLLQDLQDAKKPAVDPNAPPQPDSEDKQQIPVH